MTDPLLTVSDLNVRFNTPDGEVHAVRDLQFQLNKGETLGVVGESGSGKSQAVLAIMGLIAENGHVSGSVKLHGQELVGLQEGELNRIRGRRIGMVFQDPMTSLNPYLRVGDQMAQVLIRHRGMSTAQARKECLAMLESVQIPEAGRRLDMFPHEFSGGMRQRVMVATSLLCRPEVLIADEPTTALDVTVQARVLELLSNLVNELGTAMILITHDLGVVAGTCDRMLVMQSGLVRESGDVEPIFRSPAHDYTRTLLAAVPRLDRPGDGPVQGSVRGSEPALLGRHISVEFPVAGGWVRPRVLKAVQDVSLSLRPGETLGIVGESGSGKSTLARAVLRLVNVNAGTVRLDGDDITQLTGRKLREARRHMQVVLQDPLASLNPRMSVGDIIAEPLLTHEPGMEREERNQRVVTLMARVGLDPAMVNRYPHEFSGGQCQRVGIARALIIEPRVIVCDEPVSALDVSVQAQVIRLLKELQQETGVALIFIAHDLAVVRELCHRVMVMYLGRMVEVAEARDLYERPGHPYTRALMEAVPVPDPAVERGRPRESLTAEPPSPLSPPSGCAFRSRCVHAVPACGEAVPLLENIEGHLVACIRARELGHGSSRAP